MKKFIIIILVILFTIIIFWYLFIKEYKDGVAIVSTNEQNNIYLCIQQSQTGVNWAYVKPVNIAELKGTLGQMGVPKLEDNIVIVDLEGNTPDSQLSNTLELYRNKFIVYGKKKDYKKNISSEDFPYYIDIINVERWDIVKPIYRNYLFDILPSNYLVRYDFIN